MNFNTYSNFGGGYYSLRRTQKGGQAVGKSLSSLRLPKGGQRYSLIGGDSYGC